MDMTVFCKHGVNINYKSSHLHFFIIRVFFLFTFSLLLNTIVYSQSGNIWTFGYHTGIDFNNDPPALSNPLPNIENANSSASICDSFGKLLFFTDGKNIYNSKNKLYNNGTGLLGNNIFNQSVLILPPTVKSMQYFVVTINETNKTAKGIYYHKVDHKTETVTEKNHLLASGCFLSITTIRHSNNKDYWIIAKKFPDTIYIFRLIDEIIYKPEKVVFTKPQTNVFKKQYYCHMNPSFDGKLLVETCFYESKNESEYASYLFFYQFDASTGKLSGKRIILSSFKKEKGYPLHMYNQSAFSSNDSFIYITDLAIYPRTAPLIQLNRYTLEKFELYSNNLVDPFTAIKTGPDGRIYITYTFQPYLAVIKEPDFKGYYCNLREKYLKISDSKYTWFSLPNSIFKPNKVRFSYIMHCDSTVELINKSDTAFFNTFTWFFPNGDSVKSKNCRYKFGKSGWHFIKLRAETPYGYCQFYSDYLLLSNKPKADFKLDSNIACQWNEFHFYNNSFSEIIKSTSDVKWFWTFGDGGTSTSENPVHIFSKPGKHTISLVYSNGYCTDTIVKDSVLNILEAVKPGFTMSQQNYCAPYLLQIFSDTRGIIHNQSFVFGDGSSESGSSPSHFFEKPGNYQISQTLIAPNGCKTGTSKILHLRNGFSSNEETEILTTNVNTDNHIILTWKARVDAFSYQVLRESDYDTFLKISSVKTEYFLDKTTDAANKIYRYKILPFDSCGRPGKSVNTINNILVKAEVNSIDYSIIKWNAIEGWSKGVQEYILEYRNNDNSFEPVISTISREYQDNEYFTNNQSLQKCYRIRAIENGGNNQESISNEICLNYETFIFVPNAFTPNGDGVNDSFCVVGICIPKVKINIFNYWGETIFSSNENQKYWDGKYLGENVDTGPYVYVISATTNEGKHLEYEGIVNLIR